MTTFDVSFSQPTGLLRCTSCVASGHLQVTPDVMLGEICPNHGGEWVFCAGCNEIWCPGGPPSHTPHQGTIVLM